MNENTNESHEFLIKVESFLRCSLENIIQYQHHRQDWKVEMNYLGEVYVSSLCLGFKILWKAIGFSDEENVLWEVDGEEKKLYLLEVRSGLPVKWTPLSQDTQDSSRKIILSYSLLKQLETKGMLDFWLALLKGELFSGSIQNFLFSVFSQISISPSGLRLLANWLLPLSGMGILLFTKNDVLPWVWYGGKKPHLKLKEKNGLDGNWMEATKKFRQQNHLPVAIGIRFTEKTANKGSFLSLFSSYGKEWMISIPLEIHDLFQALPEIFAFFPGKKITQECSWNKEDFFALLLSYWENGKKFLQEESVFLELRDQDSSLVFKIHSAGIEEVQEKENVVLDNLFSINIDLLSTATDWLNETYLRLMTKFLEQLVPAEISEKVQREETLLFLQLRSKKGEILDMFVSGGHQQIPEKEWQGDFHLALLSPKNKRILWTESANNSSLFLATKGKNSKVHFPLESSLSKVSLEFEHSAESNAAWGLRKWVSKTSLLSDITPGCYGASSIWKIKGHPEILFRGQKYHIFSGVMVSHSSSGRALKHHGFVKCISQTYIQQNKAKHFRFSSCPLHKEIPDWWKAFVRDYEQYGFETDLHSFQENPHSSFYSWIEENKIAMTEALLPEVWIFHSWAVPYDRQGNFLIRARGITQSGFAFLEFPCYIPEIKRKEIPLALKIQKKNNTLSFWHESVEIFSIEKATHLNLLKPGLSWVIQYYFAD